MLGIPDIETLCVLTIKYNTICRKLTSDEKANKRQRNCQCERAVQTEGGKLQRYAYNKQDVDAQKQCNTDNKDENYTNRKQHINVLQQHTADNVDKPVFVPNPMVMDNNHNRNQSIVSDQIINDN